MKGIIGLKKYLYLSVLRALEGGKCFSGIVTLGS